MLRHHVLLAPEVIGFAPRHASPLPHARPGPRRNRILAALPLQDYQRLLSQLSPLPLPIGWTIYGAGDRERYLYFPTEGIVSRCYLTESGASAAFAITGREGVIGLASFLGGRSTPSVAVVTSPGWAWRLEADRLDDKLAGCGTLRDLLLRYTLALLVQTGQMAVCNRRHPLEQQLCRWILSCLDRLPSNELAMTQELIAQMLGVRRESVTEVAGELQREGLIHYSRGHIAVLDRQRLEARACECYAVVKRVHDGLPRAVGIKGDECVHGAVHPRRTNDRMVATSACAALT
jgi:CRP-like cAMP-binding protein